MIKRNKKVKKNNIILASGSPRRKEILSQVGLDFDVIISDVDEVITIQEDIIDNPTAMSTIVSKRYIRGIIKEESCGWISVINLAGVLIAMIDLQKNHFTIKTNKFVIILCIFTETTN